jgi:RNA polymerase sigma factor (sigma-70 family)
MTRAPTHEVNQGDSGDCCSAPALLPRVYDQLRQLARRCMADERSGHTLQATALVHEAYARLAGDGGDPPDWADRAHFFHAAAEAMRHILIDHARARQARKRGGNGVASDHADGPAREAAWRRAAYSVVELAAAAETDAATVLVLEDALSELERREPHLAEIVRLRFYAGLSVEQTAAALGVSPRTVKRDWSFARAWLFRRLSN